MHYVCRGSSDSTNIALDLEIMLMKHNANIYAEVNGRYPLHEVFIKSAESNGVAPAKDPIEVCNILVEAMKGMGIDKVDGVEGRAPLHYAAESGATICSLLLLSKGTNFIKEYLLSIE